MSASGVAPRAALLLLGPTGSGKSPLGRALERRAGWPHLDFGAELRRIAAGQDAGNLAPGEREFVRRLVATNALFPDDSLPLVRRIVGGVLAPWGEAKRVVLNGVPRTVAQALGLGDLLAIDSLVVLSVAPEVVLARIARRTAGEGEDDSGREDDTLDAVARKLALYEVATAPLAEHYRCAGVKTIEFAVATDTEAEGLARELLRRIV